MTKTYLRCSQEIWIYFRGIVKMDEIILIPKAILGKDLNHTQIILLWVIRKLSTKEKWKCYATNEELGEIMWTEIRTIQRWIKKLVELWFITIERQICRSTTKMSPTNNQLETEKTIKIRVLATKMSPLYNNIYSIYTNTSKKKEERNIKKEEMEKMLEVFRKDERLVRFMEEADVIRWWEHKQASKKPYKDTDSFIKALVKIKNIIKDYWWMPKADRNRRNRFNFAVNEAIERWWEWLNWYDSMEQVYESSKNDLYPNPKQNE